MSINLDSVLAIESTYALATLPRSDNAALVVIPTLAIRDKFIYKGMLGNAHRFRHVETGHTVALQPVFFLDSDRFYYTLKGPSSAKTALFVNTPTNAKELFGNKTTATKAGTIFTEYREDPDDKRFYIITTNNGSEYSVFQTSCIRICDIEKENESKPKLKLHAQSTMIKENSLTFNRGITLNGLEFSSAKDADNAEQFVRQLHELIHSASFTTTNDAQNALALAKSMGAFC